MADGVLKTLVSWPWIVAVLLLAYNLVTFFIMGWDKRCARLGRRRVPEKRLWFTAFLFGAAGCFAGMLAFRHKTRKFPFPLGFTLLMVGQLAIYWFFFTADWSAVFGR